MGCVPRPDPHNLLSISNMKKLCQEADRSQGVTSQIKLMNAIVMGNKTMIMMTRFPLEHLPSSIYVYFLFFPFSSAT